MHDLRNRATRLHAGEFVKDDVRRCVVCRCPYRYPTDGGYARCWRCRRVQHAAAYKSMQCPTCGNDYLWPVYGDRRGCNQCAWGGVLSDHD